MSWSILSPILIVGSALLFIALERRWPYDRAQKFFREGFWSDLLLYSLAQSYLLGLAIAWLIETIDSSTGLSRLRLVSDWPVWVQVLFFLVTHDLYIYLFHRAQHASPFLWRIHEAHHSTTSVDWLSGSRSHALEIMINQTIEFAPIVLLGAPPEVAIIKGTMDAVWGMYIHSNIDVRSGFLQRFINGPEMHRWHHALEIRDGVNFATKLAIWDWIFGTAHLPATKPAAYGIDDVVFPSGYLRQHLFAFRRRRARPALSQDAARAA
jgi:sterol desaturase/sphingolipid hydroxylase (fatty acid hydroxylase superfamily)